MAKYQTSSNAQSTGWGMKVYFDNINASSFLPIVRPIMANYGLRSIEDIQDDGWYPIQMSLDIFRAIDEHDNASSNYVALGTGMAANAPFPEEIQTIPQVLAALNDLYTYSVRNFPESEMYGYEEVNDHHIRLIDNNPYPHDMIYGLVYGLVKRFAPRGSQWTVRRTYLNPDDPNADGAIYDITW